jgi:hypothetical protein
MEVSRGPATVTSIVHLEPNKDCKSPFLAESTSGESNPGGSKITQRERKDSPAGLILPKHLIGSLTLANISLADTI